MPVVSAKNLEQQALQRFVRSRAADFSDEERRDLAVWLSDERHRAEFARLENTWTTLDALASEARAMLPRRRRFGAAWRLPAAGVLAAGLVASALYLGIWSDPAVHRYQTAVAEHRVLTLMDGTTVALNADSAVDLTDGRRPRIELLRGDVFVDVQGGVPLEVRVGDTIIRDIGTRFAVNAADGGGGSVAVSEGMVEVHSGAVNRVVHAGRRVRFDTQGALVDMAVAPDAVAPWREQRWRFAATPLSALSAELARQQRIQVDIADPADAALTVSGTFSFNEPDRVLWAAAQVHGLELERLGERHFRLRRAK